MSITFRCPECQENVHVSATLAGMHSPCPSCYVNVPVPDVAPQKEKPADGEPHTEIHSREVQFHLTPPPDKLSPPWRWVMIGLSLIFIGGLAGLAVVGLIGISGFTRPHLEKLGVSPFASALVTSTLFRLALILTILGGILFLAGMALCLKTPREAKARRWVVAAWIGIVLCGLLIVGYVITINRLRENMPVSPVTILRMEIAIAVVVMVEYLLCALFVGALAYHLEEPSLARQCLYFVLGFSIFGLLVGILSAMSEDGPDLHRLVRIVGAGGFILLFGWLQSLVGRTAWRVWGGMQGK